MLQGAAGKDPVAKEVPQQIAVLGSGAILSILDESSDWPAFSTAIPKLMPTLGGESPFSAGC